MKSCPACHRPVPDDAAVCPHAGCGKRLSPTTAARTKKRPPPPGPVSLSHADLPTTPTTGVVLTTRPAGSKSRRVPGATLVLLALLLLLVGGIFYAAVAHRRTPQPTETVASTRAEVQKGPSSGASQPGASQPGASKPGASKPGASKPGASKPGAPKTGAPKTGDGETAAAARPATPPVVDKPQAMDHHEPPAEAEKVEKVAEKVAESPAEPLGLYSQRTRADRETWVGQVGGTPESELGVAEGLDWLARHQAEDGHWGPDCLGPDGSRCEKEHPCGGAGMKYEAALTGLAVLAFQAGGNYDFNGRKHTENVRRGLDWLVARQGANGEIVGSLNPQVALPSDRAYYNQRYMYEHGIATFALAEACALARSAQRHPEEKYLAAAIKAVGFIEAQQHDDGGWRYRAVKSDRSDTSVSGWAMLALKTAAEADIKVNPATISKMRAYFKRMADPLTGRTRYIGWRYVTEATTGVGMMVDEFVNRQPDSELIHLGSAYLADQAEARWRGEGSGEKTDGVRDPRFHEPDFYLWYNCTLAMFLAGGDAWDRWNNVVRNHVLSLQLRGSDCARGSWDPDDQWGHEGGRVYSTALAVLTLEVYYRFARKPQRQE